METPLYPTHWSSPPPNLYSSSLKIAPHHEIRFATTHPEEKNTQGTVVILESYAKALEEYFLPMHEISNRGFYTAIFDWSGQEKSKIHKQKKLRHHYFDINRDLNDLDKFLKNVVYPDCPPPYYMLTYGMGGLIALSGLDILNPKFNRMLCISPLFAPFGNNVNGFQHKLSQFLSDIGLGFLPAKSRKKLKQENTQFLDTHKILSSPTFFIKPPTFQWMASVFNTIDIMKKNILNGHLQIPTLFILANQNNIINNIEIRQLCQQTHLTESLTITGAKLDTIMYEESYKQQFWAAFDAFIPRKRIIK
ncbi:serine aminopeptidase domain-containing protein [Bartonella raoultii]|uniref:Alpha/beta hydrolase n=1 Tax=Bartonella raoultii TaxID=1457020 RepID=A0ABS7I5J5_9HYPH|nr:alpha/beta hydrolase [Bartonella raoultii]MBX4335627.1 alpha/beta hydrolase [Bartonella raoultii]